jgi:hypothetical protein
MKYLICFPFLLILLIGCDNERTNRNPFNVIDVTYFSSYPDAFSVKILSTDTVYMMQYFSGKPEKRYRDTVIYRGILNYQLKKSFDSLLRQFRFREYNAAYDSKDIDGEEYHIFFDSASIQKLVYIHSDNAPKELRQFKDWIFTIRRQLSFALVDTVMQFRSFDIILPPEMKVHNLR